MPSVLFVCTANRCRSPMAAALFKDLLGRNGLPDQYRVESAGTWAEEGRPATSLACQAMRERGLDLSSHRSRRVTRELLSAFDMILVMEQGHEEALQVEFSEVKDRVRLLSRINGEDFNIPDPYGGTIETYRTLAQELADVLHRGLPSIRSDLEQAQA